MKKTLLTGLACGMFVFGMTGTANANMIINGDFEDPGIESGWLVYDSIPGWLTTDGTGIEIQHNGLIPEVFANDGFQYVELDSDFENGGNPLAYGTNSTMVQSIDTVFGQTYDISFAYRNRVGTELAQNGIEVYWNDSPEYFIGASDDPFYDYFEHPVENTTALYNWQVFTFSVKGEALDGFYDNLWFSAIGEDDSVGGFIDSVTMTPVPEPATMLLLGTGLAGLVGLQRRRRSSRG